MFDHISGKYDLLNSLLSVGIDRYWRKKLVNSLTFSTDQRLLFMDLAAGTCVLSFEALRKFPLSRIDAVDISSGMLNHAKVEINKRNLQKSIHTILADAEALPVEDHRYDAVFIAFGIRNFEHLEKGLSEMSRVLKPGGQLRILEFSQPRNTPFKQLFRFYFKNILPAIGNFISRDPRAYSYLFESVQHFPDYERLTTILKNQGFRQCDYKPLTFGICTLYQAIK